MNKAKTLVCLATIASLGLSSVSFAQGHDRGNDRNDHNDQRYEHRNDQRYEHRNDRRDQRDQHADWRGDRGDRHDNFSYGARGPEWRRGGRVPPEYRNRQYVVSNWRAHHLNAPPRGYQWVQVGGDYVLVAIATGIIAQLLLNH